MTGNPVDLTAIRHAKLTFDMAPIPLYVDVAYLPNPDNDSDGTIVCMDLYTDVGHTKLLVDGVLLTSFAPDTQHELEDELHRHLLSQAQRKNHADRLSNLVWNIATAGMPR